MDAVRLRMVVSGRVQGVFFRDTCAREARAAGVNGWAKNLDSGDVEVVLEGPRDAVDRVAAICRAGPPGARVTDVRITDEAPRGERGFSVR